MINLSFDKVESNDYRKLRELKKTMESLQEECDVKSFCFIHS